VVVSISFGINTPECARWTLMYKEENNKFKINIFVAYTFIDDL